MRWGAWAAATSPKRAAMAGRASPPSAGCGRRDANRVGFPQRAALTPHRMQRCVPAPGAAGVRPGARRNPSVPAGPCAAGTPHRHHRPVGAALPRRCAACRHGSACWPSTSPALSPVPARSR
ncbi:hypothetical protein G6F46_013786 [Rhizopus delemar]|nr:hypothetical protein G6F46_013786 [Rhizopus delemar]